MSLKPKKTKKKKSTKVKPKAASDESVKFRADNKKAWLELHGKPLPSGPKQKNKTVTVSYYNQSDPKTGEWPWKKKEVMEIPWSITIRSGTGSSRFDSSTQGLKRTYEMKDFTKPDQLMRVKWDRIDHLSDWGYRFGRPLLVEMDPVDYLGFTTRPLGGVFDESSIASINKGIDEKNVFETPNIDVNVNGEVVASGHEGRHRAEALRRRGEKKMLVVLYDRKYKEHTWHHHEADWVEKLVRKRIDEK